MSVFRRTLPFEGVDLARRLGAATLVAAVFVGTVTAFAAIAPVNGTVHHVVVLPGSLPLRMADALVPIAVAYVSLLQVRLYLTAVPAILLGAALGLAVGWPRSRLLVLATLLALGSGATVTVLTGCHCGTGMAVPLGWKALGAL